MPSISLDTLPRQLGVPRSLYCRLRGSQTEVYAPRCDGPPTAFAPAQVNDIETESFDKIFQNIIKV